VTKFSRISHSELKPVNESSSGRYQIQHQPTKDVPIGCMDYQL